MIDNNFVTSEEQQALLAQCIRSGKLVSGLIRSWERRP
jgi:hypothetical protein